MHALRREHGSRPLRFSEMITRLVTHQQLERFKVERYRQLRDRTWAWVTVGYFNTGTMREAREKGRDAIADKLCILRAVPVGREAR